MFYPWYRQILCSLPEHLPRLCITEIHPVSIEKTLSNKNNKHPKLLETISAFTVVFLPWSSNDRLAKNPTFQTSTTGLIQVIHLISQAQLFDNKSQGSIIMSP